MPKRNDLTISKRTVDGLSAAEDTVFWDHDLPGFVEYNLIPLI